MSRKSNAGPLEAWRLVNAQDAEKQRLASVKSAAIIPSITVVISTRQRHDKIRKWLKFGSMVDARRDDEHRARHDSPATSTPDMECGTGNTSDTKRK
jgi:hypothetical protein